MHEQPICPLIRQFGIQEKNPSYSEASSLKEDVVRQTVNCHRHLMVVQWWRSIPSLRSGMSTPDGIIVISNLNTF